MNRNPQAPASSRRTARSQTRPRTVLTVMMREPPRATRTSAPVTKRMSSGKAGVATGDSDCTEEPSRQGGSIQRRPRHYEAEHCELPALFACPVRCSKIVVAFHPHRKKTARGHKAPTGRTNEKGDITVLWEMDRQIHDSHSVVFRCCLPNSVRDRAQALPCRDVVR